MQLGATRDQRCISGSSEEAATTGLAGTGVQTSPARLTECDRDIECRCLPLQGPPAAQLGLSNAGHSTQQQAAHAFGALGALEPNLRAATTIGSAPQLITADTGELKPRSRSAALTWGPAI